MPSSREERRRFQRIATDKSVEIESAGNRYAGSVVDISLRGVLVDIGSAAVLPRQGDAARARIQLSDPEPCIELEGTIAHVEPGQLGLHCTTLDLESAARLRRLVELNLADDRLLERELGELIRDQAD
jgi:hypothetical protein